MAPQLKQDVPRTQVFTAALSRTAAAAAILYIVAAHRDYIDGLRSGLKTFRSYQRPKQKLNTITPKRDPTELPTDKSIYPCPLVKIKLYSDTKSEGNVRRAEKLIL